MKNKLLDDERDAIGKVVAEIYELGEAFVFHFTDGTILALIAESDDDSASIYVTARTPSRAVDIAAWGLFDSEEEYAAARVADKVRSEERERVELARLRAKFSE